MRETVILRYCKFRNYTLCLHHNCESRLPRTSFLSDKSSGSSKNHKLIFKPQTQGMNRNFTYQYYTLLLTFFSLLKLSPETQLPGKLIFVT